MAETSLQFVPCDATYQPSLAALESARKILESILTDAREVTTCNYPGIQFFDSGQEWEYPTRTVCGANTESWFQEAMGQAWDEEVGAYTDLSATAPCCGTAILLNQLHYPGGDRFASFLLEADRPSRDVTDAQHRMLETILGSNLIKKLVAR